MARLGEVANFNDIDMLGSLIDLPRQQRSQMRFNTQEGIYPAQRRHMVLAQDVGDVQVLGGDGGHAVIDRMVSAGIAPDIHEDQGIFASSIGKDKVLDATGCRAIGMLDEIRCEQAQQKIAQGRLGLCVTEFAADHFPEPVKHIVAFELGEDFRIRRPVIRIHILDDAQEYCLDQRLLGASQQGHNLQIEVDILITGGNQFFQPL